MVEMTIKLPDSLAEQVSAVQDRVPELLAHGLGKLSPVPNEVYRYILEFLISRPSPEEIMDFGPTPAMQARATDLLEKNRSGNLSALESAELDEYMRINHLITMLKAQTLPHLTSSS
jgi:hypothetical protein